MNYLNEEEYFLDEAWVVYGSYFSNKENLIIKYREIKSSENKQEFLRVVSRYNYLVKDINYSSSKKINHDLNYVSDTHKFITIIALIESLLHDEEYEDFYQWLMGKDEFPLMKTEITKSYDDYKKVYGSRRSVKEFFTSLDNDAQTYIKKAIIPLKQSKTNDNSFEDTTAIDKLASLLYQIRSDFIHNAEIVNEFSDISTFTHRKKKPYLFKISIFNLCMIFELGVLKHFNIEPEKKPVFIFYEGFSQA